MEIIAFNQIPDLFAVVGKLFVEKKEELCDMDARLGDGDLGLTMSKGYSSLPELIRNEMDVAGGDIGKLLMKAGMKMSSLVPSTMGWDWQHILLDLQPEYKKGASVRQVSAQFMILYFQQLRQQKS